MKWRDEVIVLITFPLVLFGCGRAGSSYPLPKAGAKGGDVVIESRLFEIGPEKFEADFGTIMVPENRIKSSSRLIHIPFLRIHSQSKKPAEPVFGLGGGPGSSNMMRDWGIARTFLSEHDFVLVGYRGVDGSTVLDCPDVAEAFRSGRDVLSEESMKAIGAAWRSSAKRLKAMGIDLDGYTLSECIDDNEAVRAVLGYERINLLSASYGTRVAYFYGLQHPARIFRSVMSCVNPPGRFIWTPEMIDAQLHQYSVLWSKDSLMTLKSPNLYATMRTVLHGMPQSWLCVPINPGKVKVVTVALLFQRETAALVFDAYVAAERGDPSGLALMSLAYDFVVPSLSTWGDLASKAVSVDFDSSRNYSSEMDSADFPLGSPMTKLLWGPLSYYRWPMKMLPEEFRRTRPSDVETLLLSGNLDFSTPYEFAAKELLPNLKKGKQIILSDCGHFNDIWYTQSQSTKRMVTSFYNTGVPDTSWNLYVPMKFNVRWGFPSIAKAALGTIAVLVIVLIGAIIFVTRGYRKRRMKISNEKLVNAENGQKRLIRKTIW